MTTTPTGGRTTAPAHHDRPTTTTTTGDTMTTTTTPARRRAATLAAVIVAALTLAAALTLRPTTTTTTAPAAPATTTTTAPARPTVCDDHGAAVCGAVGVTLTASGGADVYDDRGAVRDAVPVTYHTTTDETGSAPSVVEYLARCATTPTTDTAPDDGARVGVRVVGVAVGATTPAAVVEYHTAAAVIGADADGVRCVVAVVPVALY